MNWFDPRATERFGCSRRHVTPAVKRVVMTSSIAAIAYGRGERTEPFTEADWTDQTNRSDTSSYDRAKTIAERAAWAWHKAEDGALELVTVNPALVLGPVLGSDFSASVEVIKKLAAHMSLFGP